MRELCGVMESFTNYDGGLGYTGVCICQMNVQLKFVHISLHVNYILKTIKEY